MRLRFLLPLISLAFLGFGCSSATPVTPVTPVPSISPVTLEDKIYTSFIINVHDFSQPEESIATVNRIIDLHEQYQMPVDIYLDDAVVQIYEDQAPELIERLKTSAYVVVSYHLRPPTPYYADFHEEEFAGLSGDKLEAALREYETHAVDLTTGKTTDDPGGYQHLKDLIGYPPYVVAQADGTSAISKALAKVYSDMGAAFTLRHGPTSAIGDRANGLLLRPEDVEVKVYERKTTVAIADLLSQPLSELPTSGPRFMNFKWHENNFYSSGTNWSGIYYAPDKKGEVPLDPPYDLSLWTTTETDKSDAEEQVQWDRYEDLLAYVKNHPELFTSVSSRDALSLIPGINE